MTAIRRLSDAPYRWDIVAAPLSEVANQEKLLPPDFIGTDGFGITEAARRYLAPLILGEAYPPYPRLASSLADVRAAVDVDDGAADVAGVLAAEEGDGRGRLVARR